MLVIDWRRVATDDIGVCPVCFQLTYRDVCSNCHWWWPYRYDYTTRPSDQELEEAARKSTRGRLSPAFFLRFSVIL